MLQQLIDGAIAKKQEERKSWTRSGKMSPSQFGYCFRRQYWYRKDVEPTNPPDARILRVFKCGNIFEDFVSAYLPETVKKQVLVETVDIKGYADYVLDDEVTDLKSQHSKSFWWMAKSDYNIDVEKKPNILQVMTYAYLLDKPKGRLVFISKDDLCVAEYTFLLSGWKAEIDKELETNRKYWIEATPPPAQPRCYWNKKLKKFKECEWCPYLDKCKEVK